MKIQFLGTQTSKKGKTHHVVTKYWHHSQEKNKHQVMFRIDNTVTWLYLLICLET